MPEPTQEEMDAYIEEHTLLGATRRLQRQWDEFFVYLLATSPTFYYLYCFPDHLCRRLSRCLLAIKAWLRRTV